MGDPIWFENGKLHFVKAKLAALTHLGPLEPTFWVLKTPKLNQIDQHNTNLQPRPTYNPKKDGLNKKSRKQKKQNKKNIQCNLKIKKKIANCKIFCFDDAFETPFGLKMENCISLKPN